MTTVATRHVGAQPSVNKHYEVYCSTEISHKNIVIFIMVLCLMVKCHSRTVRDKGISFFRVPVIVKNQGEACEELSIERRRRWLSAISRDGLTENLIQSGRVCSRHFVQGKPLSLEFSLFWLFVSQSTLVLSSGITPPNSTYRRTCEY